MPQADVKKINEIIVSGKLSRDELRSIVNAVDMELAQMRQARKQDIQPGTRVRYYNTDSGTKVKGTVLSVYGTYAWVKQDPGGQEGVHSREWDLEDLTIIGC
jgi:hypothetical protein